ncbi:MAG: VWA domain-containing protein [Phycisphaerales bacterium]|nr:VWA domain-containing protein [Phycisphaerales bacterium]
MILRFRFILFLFLFVSFGVQAQLPPSSKIPRVLFLLDGSSSMSENWNENRSRFQQAGKFILALVDSLSAANSQVEFGLRVFGHQYPAQDKNCYDTKREIMFSRGNNSQMEARLEALHGYGVSPIAYSLSEAAYEDFENESKYAYSIILVTDGGESCGGDICKVVNELLQRKIFFRPYIVSLVDYAPLKDLYKCLGTFLTVSKEQEIPKTITTIVDAHREGFERAKTGTIIPVIDIPKKADTIPTPVVVKKEDPKKIVVVAPLVKKDTLVVAPVKKKEEPIAPKEIVQSRDRRIVKTIQLNTVLKTFRTITVYPPYPQLIAVPEFVLSKVGDQVVVVPPKVKEIIPVRKVEKNIPALLSAKKKPLSAVLTVLPSPKKLSVPAFVLSKIETPIAQKADTIVIPITIKQDQVKPVIKPAEKPIVKQAKDINYTIEKTPATETLAEVYFTDGNGKFYSTTPQILLSDPISGKDINTFYRTVNADGNPDPVKVPTGKYNLSVIGSDRTFLKAIEISPNMTNKIIITVSNGSLQFVWKDSRNKKPVDKYVAVVKRNFVPQPMVKQNCDTVLPYPPGNYHIEINTLPVSVRSTDLSFGATVIIKIDVPGKVQITNSNNLGKVNFYYPHGDKFMQFYQMNVMGNPATQNIEILPGVYEVHYFVAPGLPEKVLTFHIRSDETTEIELK